MLRYHHQHQDQVLCVASAWNFNKVASGDKSGTVVIWDLDEDTFYSFPTFGAKSRSVQILSFHPQEPDVLVLGYQTGEIMIFNNKGQSQHRLVDHTGQVQSLSWSLGPTPKLLSSSADMSLVIRDGKDYKVTQQLNLTKYHEATKKSTKDRTWVAAAWSSLEPDTFYSTGVPEGKLYSWSLSESHEELKPIPFDAGHNRLVFSILPVPRTNTFITFSMDRKIMAWKENEGQRTWSLSTLGGFAYSVSLSHSKDIMAIACGDSTVRREIGNGKWEMGNRK
eukprot:TRINITY_DN4744_c0_g1_i9.p1 TRINITY_DN4744_c0_g1~~TRINITY_DN4744_c0_g1_i9.p1  ORF type:complete len:279 (+),score=45.67 TRINITY_DN4744_c0_g1_i9:233-1069(+)